MIKLNDTLEFDLERTEKKARLIVYKDGVENVCRKETIKNLIRFASGKENHLFKGRLQLYKKSEVIHIRVKGETAGVINAGDFINYLESVKN